MAIELLTFRGGLALESNGLGLDRSLFESEQFIGAWQRRETLSPGTHDITPGGKNSEGFVHRLLVFPGNMAVYRARATSPYSSVKAIGCDVNLSEPELVMPTDTNNLFIFGTTPGEEHALYYVATHTPDPITQPTPPTNQVLSVDFKRRKRSYLQYI